jgi:hypothetical protein
MSLGLRIYLSLAEAISLLIIGDKINIVVLLVLELGVVP